MLASLRILSARVGRWPRLLAAGACLLLAGLSALTAAHDRAAAAQPARAAAVVVTTRAVPAGQVLRAGDVRLERWPVSVRPPAALRLVSAVVGRRAAGPIGAREAVTPSRLAGAGLTAGLRPGLGAVPIDVAGAQTTALVHPGDRVDVLCGPGPDTPTGDAGHVDVLATAATVLAVLKGTDDASTTVVIAADRPTALRIAQGGSSGTFTIMVISP